jgi:histidinol-phosphate/aromatic aminotransferase/cobyric acid decarboxylase-like protein
MFLERPSLMHDHYSDLHELERLCKSAASSNTIVVIDESNANYYPPSFSAANLLPETENLIVLRGLSKAYQLGGLRLGYCIASQTLNDALRFVVPPLLVSSLSLGIGARLLKLGDITQPLRDRIAAHKRAARPWLEARLQAEVTTSSEYLPYLFTSADADTIHRLEACGIRGKSHSVWSAAAEKVRQVYRISVPLRSDRFEQLRQRLLEA